MDINNTKRLHIKSVVFVLMCFSITLHAQHKFKRPIYPEVDKPVPQFILHDIRYFPKKQATDKDFKGKWLVLDFWSKGCGSCVASFPKIDALQKKFTDKVQFMYVGWQDPDNQIQVLFEKYRKKENLSISSAFDSVLCQNWEIYSVPHLFIIDPKGIVRGITNSIHAEEISAFLDGKTPNLAKTYHYSSDSGKVIVDDNGLIPFDDMKPFLVDGNGSSDTDYVYRSILSIFDISKHSQSVTTQITDDEIKAGMFQQTGASLTWLYNFAYFGTTQPAGGPQENTYGKYYNTPVLELKDSSEFRNPFKPPYHLYSYSLIMPPQKCSKQKIQENMQRDLKNYFGFDAKIEIRKCFCWKLTATDKARDTLKTKGGQMLFRGSRAGFTARNYPVSYLIAQIQHNNGKEVPAIIDETGINGNVDITMDCILTDFDEVKNTLRSNGLELTPGEKEMKVLVISDSTVQ